MWKELLSYERTTDCQFHVMTEINLIATIFKSNLGPKMWIKGVLFGNKPFRTRLWSLTFTES